MARRINPFIVKSILRFVKPKDNWVVFESSEHHIYDNSFYLYLYLRHFKKLHLYYVIYEKKQYREAKKKGIRKSNIILISEKINTHSLVNMGYIIRNKIILKKCKTCFISYRNFYKEYNVNFYSDQVLVNLRHGQFPIKDVYSYYKGLCFDDTNKIYFRIGTTESAKMLTQKYNSLNCEWFSAPMPRLESLKDNKLDNFCSMLKIGLDKYNSNKFVLLLTTLRHVNGTFFETQFPFRVNKNEFIKVNDFLEKNKIYLLIKSHHDVKFATSDFEFSSSNIIFIDDENLTTHNLFVNNLFNYVNALITDYSSAFFDFLYLNKPIGFLIDKKMEESRKNDTSLEPKEYICGEKIRDINQLIDFLNDTAKEIDKYQAIRKKVFKKFNGKFEDCYPSKVAHLFINERFLR